MSKTRDVSQMLYNALHIFTLLYIVSCAVNKKDAANTFNGLDVIIEKKALYLELAREHQDEFGFVYSDRCDSLLFSGLSVVGGLDVDLVAARDELGRWHRTPSQDCYYNEINNIDSSRRSASTISRDMLAGLFAGLNYLGERELLNDILDYGRGNDWVMGDGPYDRTYLTPNFQDTLYRLLDKTYKGVDYLWIDPILDHQRHVVAINIITRGEYEGKIDGEMFELLKAWSSDQPGNALFSYGVHRFSDGDQTQAINILLNENYFPKDRLPMAGDRDVPHLWERDQSKWGANPESDVVFAGIDYLYVAALLERSMKQEKVSNVYKR